MILRGIFQLVVIIVFSAEDPPEADLRVFIKKPEHREMRCPETYRLVLFFTALFQSHGKKERAGSQGSAGNADPEPDI